MSDGTVFLLCFCLPMAILLIDELAEEALRAPVVLPHFPYSRQQATGASSSPEPAACAICLDELRQGQLCMHEVPACRHIFHEGCIRAWAKKKNSCPLCRIRIVPGRAAADDMV
uniref:RING-type E3 ubiquitin transferase n=1 Tax=Setaria viridis TaxID=4556 RepID=A0A4U6UW69_SETVI|nr:LOW QUALITY PROTEIN: hypothetical protein SEVIR_4G114700v2 [Setaria viridis]